jgi:hypothetical protein
MLHDPVAVVDTFAIEQAVREIAVFVVCTVVRIVRILTRFVHERDARDSELQGTKLLKKRSIKVEI